MNAQDLARWTRFAGKGGIGKCTALVDCVAQEMGEDLMFLKGDEITVLMQLPEPGFYLGHCEGVVGRFSSTDVRFYGRLKKPVMTKRTSVASGTERMSISVAERSASASSGRDDSKIQGVSRASEAESFRSKGRRSPSPVHSEKSLSRSFVSTNIGTAFRETESWERKDAIHPKAHCLTSSVSGSSVYSLGSACSASTTTSGSAYSVTSSAHRSITSDTTEMELASPATLSPASPSSALSDTLLSSFMKSLDSFPTHVSRVDSVIEDFSTSANDGRQEACALSPSLSTSGLSLGSPDACTSSLAITAPLKLSKSLLSLAASCSNNSLGSPPATSNTSSNRTPSSLSHRSQGLLSPSSTSLCHSPFLESPVTSLGFPESLSPGLPRSLSPGLQGSQTSASRSLCFPLNPPNHPSSNALTSSSPANSYGTRPFTSYTGIPSGYTCMGPPSSAPPSGPLPPAPDQGRGRPVEGDERMVEEDEMNEGNSTRLSALEAFRQQLCDESENVPSMLDSEAYGLSTGWPSGLRADSIPGTKNLVKKDSRDGKGGLAGMGPPEEDKNSDGEVGIGLSLMNALRNGDEDDEDDDEPSNTLRHSVNAVASGAGEVLMPWTQYTPMASLDAASLSDHKKPLSPETPNDIQDNSRSKLDGIGDSDHEDDGIEGGYWDDIYDDYRYSRYSLASKRFSMASRRMSVVSKASGTSKSSVAPPVPVPAFSSEYSSLSGEGSSSSTDRYNIKRPSEFSVRDDGPSLCSRPSLESMSTAASLESSASQLHVHQFTSPSFDCSLSDDGCSSLYSNQTLDRLSSQFPAVPTGVPVRLESRLRVVNHDYLECEEDEQQVKDVQDPCELTEDNAQNKSGDVSQQTGSVITSAVISRATNTSFGPVDSLRVTADNKIELDCEHDVGSQDTIPLDLGKVCDATDSHPNLQSTFEMTEADEDKPESRNGNSQSALASPVLGGTSGVGLGTGIAVDDAHSTAVNTHEPSPTNVGTQEYTQLPQQLRPRGQSTHPFHRTSIFLPHPNAPKVSGRPNLGPMYARLTETQPHPALPPDPTHLSLPPNSSTFAAQVLHCLRNLFQAPGPGLTIPPYCPPMTLFARCQSDLSTSLGPVPIVFSLEPLPQTTPPPSNGSGQHSFLPGISPHSVTLVPAAHKGSLLSNRTTPLTTRNTLRVHENVRPREEGHNPADQSPLRLPRRSATTTVGRTEGGEESTSIKMLPNLRPGFVPRSGAAPRPRSRSFSTFEATVIGAGQLKSSDEQPVGPISVWSPHPANVLKIANVTKPIPAPLQLKSNTMNFNGTAHFTGASPIAAHATSRAESFAVSPTLSVSGTVGLSPSINVAVVVDSGLTPSKTVQKGESGLDLANEDAHQSTVASQVGSPELPRKISVNCRLLPQNSELGDSHMIVQSPLSISDHSQSTRSSPLMHDATLRNKLSLPTLRGKSSGRQRVDDFTSTSSERTCVSISAEGGTVQVQDMDFELVKPSIPLISGRVSQDSTVGGHDILVDSSSPGLLGDTASILSSAPRSPMATSDHTTNTTGDMQAAVDAHRQREIKWMALLPIIPPAQARKHKKIKRLLQEGVPSSVRYLVWCHLTDSKARAFPGVYTKLSKRSPVPAFSEIEKDAARCFPDQNQLHRAEGPIVSLLQAYLSMAPDIHYSSALTFIAGHLLLLAPEEDAFWIFTSIMDAHLRSYFATSTIQTEVDGALLSKALESNDSMLHKKIYVSLQMNPTNITRPWFSALFVGTLPPDILHRVWDIFLYEGMTFLFRVGLAVIHYTRHLVFQATSEEIALEYLAHPPVACLPSSVDDFLSFCFTVKLKDNDVRKQRIKMEAQVKRQTQARFFAANGLRQGASISLPRP